MNDRLTEWQPCGEPIGFVMKPGHPQWRTFCDRLSGPEACDFKEHPTKGATWKCAGGEDRSMATRILKDMGADVEASLEFFSQHGGFCDCEILFNVDREDFALLWN